MRTFQHFLLAKWRESAVPRDLAVPDDDLPDPRQPTPTMRLAGQPAQAPTPGQDQDYDFSPYMQSVPYMPLQPPAWKKLVTKKVLGKKAGESDKKIKKRLERVPGGTVAGHGGEGAAAGGTFTPDQHRGIPRREMPQLKQREEFIHFLQSRGVPVSIKKIAPIDLIRNPSNKEKLMAHAQANIYVDKAARMIRKDKLLEKLIILTKDGIIFDGNHHWFALMAYKKIRKMPIPMYVVGMDFDPLKTFATRYFPNVTFEEMWNPLLEEYSYDMILPDDRLSEFWTEV